jgi:hypothetical protein
MLDGMAQPCSARRLSQLVSDLVQLDLVRLYRPNQKEESDPVRQAQLIQSYERACEDGERFPLIARIRSGGVEFYEKGTVKGQPLHGVEQVRA